MIFTLWKAYDVVHIINIIIYTSDSDITRRRFCRTARAYRMHVLFVFTSFGFLLFLSIFDENPKQAFKINNKYPTLNSSWRGRISWYLHYVIWHNYDVCIIVYYMCTVAPRTDLIVKIVWYALFGGRYSAKIVLFAFSFQNVEIVFFSFKPFSSLFKCKRFELHSCIVDLPRYRTHYPVNS